MEQVASFVARWRATILAVALVVALALVWVGGARADGPGSGTPSIDDSYISGEAGWGPRAVELDRAQCRCARAQQAL